MITHSLCMNINQIQMRIMLFLSAILLCTLINSTVFAQKQSRVYKIVPIMYNHFKNQWDYEINGTNTDSTIKKITIRGKDFKKIRFLSIKKNNSDKYKDRIILKCLPKVTSDDEFDYYFYPSCESKYDGPCTLKFEIKKYSNIIYIDLIYTKYKYGFMFEVKSLLLNKKII